MNPEANARAAAPADRKRSTGSLVKGWILISRVPFLSVGILPFVLGTLLAVRGPAAVGPAAVAGAVGVGAAAGAGVSWPVFWLGFAAVVLIMLATYHNGEYYDEKEDRRVAELGRHTRFSGGSQAVNLGLVPASHARIGALLASAGAIAIGVVLQRCYHTGPLTIPLGLVGLLAGFFYSAPPVRWVGRGMGELLIGICYGWLPVAVGFYLQRGAIPLLVSAVSLPIAFTIFNVIFMNEYPDRPADAEVGKRTLLVRIGPERGALVYVVATVLGWGTFIGSVALGYPRAALFWYLPIALLSLVLVAMMAQRRYQRPRALELLCGLTIVVNLGTTAAYILPLCCLRG
jgi:1,4-dihydroxy-2-naphthoate polyprenyltransferase